MADDLGRTYADRVEAVAPGAKRIVDKQLGNYQMLGVIALLFPGARIIHCTRNPMDTCLSCYAQKLPPGTNTYASSLVHLGAFSRDMQHLMTHWCSVLSVPILEVRYEETVANVETVARSVIEFLGLPWDDACLHFHESRRTVLTLSADQVRRPIYTTSVGRAKRFGALLDPLREALGELGDA